MFRVGAAVAAAVLLSLSTTALSGPATAAEPAYTLTENLHFKVTVGPADKTCDVVGDLYVPSDAASTNRMPAILSTNGFGGSKDDQDALSAYAASHGYVALTYSGLGFGGSSCEIYLDDPDYDGEAAAQLIDFLGGSEGIAYRSYDGATGEHSDPVPALTSVRLDGPGDPRVGMVGGSYGGQVQYAAAAKSTALDTIVPVITWNDLSYSLAPNGTDQVALPGQEFPGVSTRTPGAAKMNWALGFSAVGLTGDAQNQQPDNPLGSRCPNFREEVCPALVNAAATGTLRPQDVGFLRHASVASYQDRVQIPTLILQGQADTLFNLNEAAATYRALKAQGTEVKMSWIEFGHSGPAAPGELDLDAPDPATQHVTKRIFDWFAHYLQDDETAPTGPEFSWFRDWISYSGIATPAYAASDSFPVGRTSTWHLSSTPQSTLAGGSLVTDAADVTAGTESFSTPGGGAPASNAEDADVLSSFFEKPWQQEPVQDPPGTFARYDTDPLTRRVVVVGSPEVRLQVRAPSAEPTQGEDAGKLVLFLKVMDVAPGGDATVVRNLAAPVRVPDVTEPFTVTMPAFVHRFARGHRIRLVVAGASPNYRGSTLTTPVTIATAPSGSSARVPSLQTLTMPTLGNPPVSGGTATSGGPAGGDALPGQLPGPSGAQPAGAAAPSPAEEAGTAGRAGGTQGAGRPAVSMVSRTSGRLPDTGGPAWQLGFAGALLVALGAHQLARQRG